VTGGGYYSIDTSGPNSRGPTATCFDVPSDPDVPVPNQALLAYPVATTSKTFAHRNTDYVQIFHWDAAPESIPPPGPGLFAPGDQVPSGGTFIDTTSKAAMAYAVDLAEGCVYYGSNAKPQNRPIMRVGESFIKPLSTDVATSSVKMPATVDWPTGTMVNLEWKTGGCTADQYTACTVGLQGGGYWAYFLRKEGSGAYTFHLSAADAADPQKVSIKLTAPVTLGMREVAYCGSGKGSPASLNSERETHWLYLYAPADLIAVAKGEKKQNEIQPSSMTRLEIPNLPQPSIGMPSSHHHVAGIGYLPSQRLFAVLYRDLTARPRLHLWRAPQ
jgi:hypothetical protein